MLRRIEWRHFAAWSRSGSRTVEQHVVGGAYVTGELLRQLPPLAGDLGWDILPLFTAPDQLKMKAYIYDNLPVGGPGAAALRRRSSNQVHRAISASRTTLARPSMRRSLASWASYTTAFRKSPA